MTIFFSSMIILLTIGPCAKISFQSVQIFLIICRITLLFLDEVFDLADRNMWLRRQIITVLRYSGVKLYFNIKIVFCFEIFLNCHKISINSLTGNIVEDFRGTRMFK